MTAGGIGAVTCGTGAIGGLAGVGIGGSTGLIAGAGVTTAVGRTGIPRPGAGATAGPGTWIAGAPAGRAAGVAPTAVPPARGCAGATETGGRKTGNATATGTAATGSVRTAPGPGARSVRFATGLRTVVAGTEANGTTTGPGAAGRTGTGAAGAASSSVLATTGVTPDVARVGCTVSPRSRCAPASACGVTTSARAATG